MHWFAAIHRLEEFDTVDAGSRPGEHPASRESLDFTPDHPALRGFSEVCALLRLARRETPFEGVYFGSEFCERLMPLTGELDAALAEADKRQLRPVLLIPPLSDAGIDRLGPLLERMRRLDRPEVVLNDWGTIRHVRMNFPDVTPLGGRLLSRMMKEVRIAHYLTPESAPRGALDVLRDCGYSNPDYREILADYGIGRVEFDIPPQGLDVRVEDGVRMSLHVPFAYVTTGRNCMPGSLNLKPERKFTPQAHCTKECTRWNLHLRQRLPEEDRNGPVLFQRGNTVFTLENRSHVEELLSGPNRGIDRVILDTTLAG